MQAAVTGFKRHFGWYRRVVVGNDNGKKVKAAFVGCVFDAFNHHVPFNEPLRVDVHPNACTDFCRFFFGEAILANLCTKAFEAGFGGGSGLWHLDG